VDFGFLEETRHGGLSRKTRVASEWRLTAFKCDLTGALKTNLFMQRGAWARDSRLSQTRSSACLKRVLRVSQKTTQPVSNEVQ
jgi:hypothetical protein